MSHVIIIVLGLKALSEILRVEDLKKYYKVKRGLLGGFKYLRAVDGVTFSVSKGSTLGIVGESGSGKTTLGLTILRLVEPTSGHIYFFNDDVTKLKGKELKSFRRNTGIVFQDPYSSLNPRMKVKDILERPLKIHENMTKEEMLDRILGALSEVGLNEEFLYRYPHELSGGQQQRVAIARAMILKPKLLVLDEPTSSLDVSVQAQILNLLLDLQRKYLLTYIFITHDLLTARHMSDSIAVMYLGKIVEYANADEIFKEPKHPYTALLFSSIPIPNPKLKSKKNIVVFGEPPSPLNPPSGCRFHPRCPYADDICKHVEPELIEIGRGHKVACHKASELSLELEIT